MSDSSISPFLAFLADKYPVLKATQQNVGRRRLKLTLASEFWALDQEVRDRYAKASTDSTKTGALLSTLEEIHNDDDDLDCTPGMGIIVRTDYSDDAAWDGFVSALRDAEKDLGSPDDDETPIAGTSTEGGADADGEPDSDSDDEMDSNNDNSEEQPSSTDIFTLLNPALPAMRGRLTGISNLAALRLFNDVDIVPAPKPPQGTHRIKPGNRIMDLNGLLEIYTGDLVWVYDAQSNRDRSVRLVNQKCETYGSATADSWRPRVSFLPELQVNLMSGAMKIDFGGLDRWDFNERRRNLSETDIMP